MTTKTIDRSETCQACGAVKKYITEYIQICDLCGKEERWPNDRRYRGDFFEVTVFAKDYDNNKDFSFCSAEHMLKFVLKQRNFDFITLPYVKESGKEEGYKNNLKISDLKRVLKIPKSS